MGLTIKGLWTENHFLCLLSRCSVLGFGACVSGIVAGAVMRIVLVVFLLASAGYLYSLATANHWIVGLDADETALAALGTTPLVGATRDDYDTAGDWGDILINKTQLSEFVGRYGVESSSIGMGELEFRYHAGQVSFVFMAVGDCQRQMHFMPMRQIFLSFTNDGGDSFFGNAPACLEEMPLRTITIRSESLLNSRFMQAPIYVPQISIDQAIEPTDTVFDVVRKLGLPPSAGTASVANPMGSFSEFSTLNYPGVTVYYQGDYELVRKWSRYASVVTTANDLIGALDEPSDEPTDRPGSAQLKAAVRQVLDDPDFQAGTQLLSDLADRLSPEIAMVQITGMPTPQMLEAHRNAPY